MSAKRHLIVSHMELIQEWHKLPRWSVKRREVLGKLNGRVPELNRILRELGPDLGQFSGYIYGGERPQAVPALSRALDLLEQTDTFMSECKVAGIPALPMIFFHPLVADPAQPLFEAKKYRQAVEDAATHVNEALQKRVGHYDIFDADLMGKAFSTDPPVKGMPRLRCPGDPQNKSVKSQREGAAAFATGCFKVIRNPAHHMTGDWNPLIAFEFLGSLSTVARWITDWWLEQYVAPIPLSVQQQAAIAAMATVKKT